MTYDCRAHVCVSPHTCTCTNTNLQFNAADDTYPMTSSVQNIHFCVLLHAHVQVQTVSQDLLTCNKVNKA